tara:strand:+ start:76 stop:288 length:213 start_codon:yes stop_codon:yes gene_type:complete
MDNKISILESKINKIEKDIEKILYILENNIEPNCSRMNTHISFIEKIYENVRSPMDYVCNTINRFYISDK